MATPALRTPNLVWWVALVAGLGALVLYVAIGLPLALLFGAGATLVGAVFLLWSSMQRLTGEAPMSLEEAMGYGAPSAEEERKRAVLRALKDLEYERSVGKISEDDYRDLSARYRKEAKDLLRALDDSLEPTRARAEKLLEKRLKAAGLADDDEPAAEQDDARDHDEAIEDDDAPQSGEDEDASQHDAGSADDDAETPDDRTAAVCSACGAKNDDDARFCKKCGEGLESDGDAS